MQIIRRWIDQLVNRIPSTGLFKFQFTHFNSSNRGMVVSLHRVTNTTSAEHAPSSFNHFIEIDISKLEWILASLKGLGAAFVSLGELRQQLKSPIIAGPLVHISFDDGYLDNYVLAYPLLQKYQVPFSVFVTSDFIEDEPPFLWWYIIEGILQHGLPVSFDNYSFKITADDYGEKNKALLFQEFRDFIMANADGNRAYFKQVLYERLAVIPGFSMPTMMSWKQLAEMKASGLCELGVHTKTHGRMSSMDDDTITAELLACQEALRIHTGLGSSYLAYPFGAWEDIGDPKTLPAILQRCGIEMAFTTIPTELNSLSNPFFMPRVFLNDSASVYTLKSRLSGSYQRGSMASGKG